MDPFNPRGLGGPVVGQNVRQVQEDQLRRPGGFPVYTEVTNITNSNTTLYTVTANRFLRIHDFGVCNINGSQIAIDVYAVAEGGSASQTVNAVYYQYPVVANDSGTLTALLDSLWPPGTFIVCNSNNATGANFWMYGTEYFAGGNQ